MGGGKGFMQIEMHYVKPHIPRPYNTHNGIEVGAVIIIQTTGLMNDICNF